MRRAVKRAILAGLASGVAAILVERVIAAADQGAWSDPGPGDGTRFLRGALGGGVSAFILSII